MRRRQCGKQGGPVITVACWCDAEMSIMTEMVFTFRANKGPRPSFVAIVVMAGTQRR